MRTSLLIALSLLLPGCGSEVAGERHTVKLKLVDGDCADAALQVLGAARASAREQASSCLQVRAQNLAGLQQALGGKLRFENLSAGPLTVDLTGFVSGACKSPPLLCGRTATSLPASGDAIELPLFCWGGSRTSDYALCAGGASSGALQLEASDGGCADDDARRVRAIRVKLGAQAASGCSAIATAQDFSALQEAIRAALSFSGLQPGATRVTLWGFDDGSCRADKLVACGQVDLLLPEAAPLPLRCAAAAPAGCPAAP